MSVSLSLPGVLLALVAGSRRARSWRLYFCRNVHAHNSCNLAFTAVLCTANRDDHKHNAARVQRYLLERAGLAMRV